jgi:Zn finger protein HypA/HybF involved in hydrogenase expression
MHELSVALEVCRIAEERLGPERAARLLAVGVEVGDEAGIEPGNLEFCLEALLASPPFGHARPDLVRLRGNQLRVSYLEVEDGDPAD